MHTVQGEHYQRHCDPVFTVEAEQEKMFDRQPGGQAIFIPLIAAEQAPAACPLLVAGLCMPTIERET
jgi:hypothetical protein